MEVQEEIKFSPFELIRREDSTSRCTEDRPGLGRRACHPSGPILLFSLIFAKAKGKAKGRRGRRGGYIPLAPF
jgi:hypothetical protein